MQTSIRLLALFALFALTVAPAVASDQAPSPARASADSTQLGGCPPPAQGVATLDTLESSAPVCSDGAPELETGVFFEPIEEMGPPIRRRYCRCGCGLTCETDADCGGASCDPFITCC